MCGRAAGPVKAAPLTVLLQEGGLGWAGLTFSRRGIPRDGGARQPHKAQRRPLPTPGRAQGPSLSVPTCHCPDWLSLAVNSRRRLRGRAGACGFRGWSEGWCRAGRGHLVCSPHLAPGFSQGPLFPPLPKMGDSSAQDPEEITRCPAHILLPPVLPHLFPLSLGGFSAGQEELTPLCARPHSDVEGGLRDFPTPAASSARTRAGAAESCFPIRSLSDPCWKMGTVSPALPASCDDK